MDLKECYAVLGGDYDAVMGRLRQEERVVKFLRLFPSDENYQLLAGAMVRQDWPVAFRAAHSLKGVALNLAFSGLARSASELTECLRSGQPAADPAPLFEAVQADYEKTLAAITAMLAQA